MQAGNQREAVAKHLEVLAYFASDLEAPEDLKAPVLRQLAAAAALWRAAAPEGQVVTTSLATESCEAAVSSLRLLHGSSPEPELTPSRCVPYSCAFLVLACTVRVFEEAKDVPVPGQTVVLFGLESAAGQRLNGAQGVVKRFHPESGRFIVALGPTDPPVEWKKVRAQNLKPEPGTGGPSAVEGARACGRACLEAVAGIFDDLLGELQAEPGDSAEDDFCTRLLQGQLATSMWEALVCCTGDGGACLRGAGLLELCSGDVMLCSLLARHVLSGHFSLHAGRFLDGFCEEHERRAVMRLRTLQESLARAYCGLFEPSALWGSASSRGTNDAPIAELQADLDAHVRRVAGAAVHLGVLEVLADAADFHLGQVGPSKESLPPVVLPLLLFRCVCSIITSTTEAQAGTIRRHIRLLSPTILSVASALAELLVDRLEAGAASGDLPCAAIRAALDAAIAVAANGLWQMSGDAPSQGKAFADLLLASPRVLDDPSLLARLVLFFLQQPPETSLVNAYRGLGEAARAAFWQQLRQRGSLRMLSPAELVSQAREYLGEVDAPVVPEAPLPAAMMNGEAVAMDQLIDRCLQELPASLQRLEPPPPPAVPAEAESQKASEGKASAPGPSAYGLGALGLPTLPGMQRRDGASAPGSPTEEKKKRLQRLARSDIAKIRGIDPSQAPQELCCAIDGKLLGVAVRSPYGHLFEKETLEHWLSRCGSVCPLTGKPLRLQDCEEDHAVERQVIEWVKGAKALYKRRIEEKRARREARQMAAGADDGACL